MNRALCIIIVCIISLQVALGATLHGTVYTPYLDVVDNAIVKIDSVPRQQIVTYDGKYRFELSEGSYKVSALVSNQGITEYSAEENISITKDGTFVLDIILFPDFQEEEELLKETDELSIDEEISEEKKSSYWFETILISILAVVLFIIWYLFKEEKKHASDDLEDQVLSFIKDEGGRTTQKDIRKNIPFSEAKVSLVIADLEEKGLVKKIKKGRGNIIVLEKHK